MLPRTARLQVFPVLEAFPHHFRDVGHDDERVGIARDGKKFQLHGLAAVQHHHDHRAFRAGIRLPRPRMIVAPFSISSTIKRFTSSTSR